MNKRSLKHLYHRVAGSCLSSWTFGVVVESLLLNDIFGVPARLPHFFLSISDPSVIENSPYSWIPCSFQIVYLQLWEMWRSSESWFCTCVSNNAKITLISNWSVVVKWNLFERWKLLSTDSRDWLSRILISGTKPKKKQMLDTEDLHSVLSSGFFSIYAIVWWVNNIDIDPWMIFLNK